ncbi:hypothetical protein K8R30_00510 [archaeon]|nr:hypothetical protein [archaeon]
MDVKIGFVLIFLVGFLGIVAGLPTGPSSLNITYNETGAGAANPWMVNISGAYVAKMNISSISQNSRWKGFVGWVNGKFTLDDSTGSTVYDWSSSTTGGEVYATRGSGSIEWGNIGCANTSQINSEDSALQHSGGDNISSTFSGTNIETYVIASFSVGVGDCFASNAYVDNVTQNSSFEEIVLFDDTDIVFATEIEDDVGGYDGGIYDFQMIVPDYGNESIGGNVVYYLYVEID